MEKQNCEKEKAKQKEREQDHGKDERKEKGLCVGQVRAVVSHAPTTDTCFLKLYIVFFALVICQEKIHVGVDICIPCGKTFCPKGVFRIWSGTCGFLTTKRPPFCDEQIECEALIPFNRCPPPAFCDADAGHSARVKQACYPFMPFKLPFNNK